MNAPQVGGVFAVAPDPLPQGVVDLTAGKAYQVLTDDGVAFAIYDDVGFRLLCLWKGCSHLSVCDWQRSETTPTPLLPAPNDPQVGGVAVTQADRDAAADYLDSCGWDWGACGDVRAGRVNHPVVQAFARHRTTPTPLPALTDTVGAGQVNAYLLKSLKELEQANDDLCAERSQAVYDLMDRETRDQLIALDDARLKARAAIQLATGGQQS